MASVRLNGKTIVIELQNPGDIAIDPIPLAQTIGASIAIGNWEAEAGAEMTPAKMEFASRFFYAGYRFGTNPGIVGNWNVAANGELLTADKIKFGRYFFFAGFQLGLSKKKEPAP